jgi:universal stress protein E
MRPIRRILVAIKDPEARSVPALHKAAQLARALGARLELFHALSTPIYANSDQGFLEVCTQDEQFALRRLQRLADGLKGRGRQRPLRVSVAVQWDTPAYEAIIRHAVASKADLIVAERHRGLHFAPAVLHFNDWELLRQSPVPVLLVKRTGRYERPVVLAAVDPTHSLDKPAQLDEIILDTSTAIAAALHGQLHSVHAYVPLTGGERPTQPLDAETAANLNRKREASARHQYERLLNGYRIARGHRHLLNLPPSEAIQTVAATTHADIVTLGAISRSGWQRLLIGNTAEDLLDPLRCDLLVVKPAQFKARVPRRPVGARFVPALAISP